MDERLRFVAKLLEGETMTEACRESGISRKTGYKIFNRYKESGFESLSDRSRRPVRYANQLPAQLEKMIVGFKREKPHWGARKIRELLVRRLDGDVRIPAKSTIHAVLHRNGLVKGIARRRHRAAGTGLSPGLAPNDLWCVDFKGGFIEEFNQERPREALAMKTPAEVYSRSPRAYNGLPELSYPLHDRDVVVTACGRICLHRKRVNLSHVFAGQRVGIKEVDEGIWIVSFMHYDLGFIDLEQKTLQPVDNPFGSRVSPMCSVRPVTHVFRPYHGTRVGVEGFEPPTSCSQSKCATRLRYTPPRITSQRGILRSNGASPPSSARPLRAPGAATPRGAAADRAAPCATGARGPCRRPRAPSLSRSGLP